MVGEAIGTRGTVPGSRNWPRRALLSLKCGGAVIKKTEKFFRTGGMKWAWEVIQLLYLVRKCKSHRLGDKGVGFWGTSLALVLFLVVGDASRGGETPLNRATGKCSSRAGHHRATFYRI